jgi:F420-non-reducing hydrogenase iron-sulfur subunit
MRLDYPANVKIIRVPCSGKGNFRARERVNHVRMLLEEIGLEGDRVRMYNLSSGEGPTFAAYAKEMTEHIKALGPNRLNNKATVKN